MSLISIYDERTFPATQHDARVSAVIVSTNALFCMGLRQILSDSCFTVSEAAFDEAPLPAFLQATGPVLFIIDVSQYPDPTEIVRRLRSSRTDARIVVMAERFDPQWVLLGADAGVDGFCSSAVNPDILIKSLELVVAGGSIFPSAVIRSLVDHVTFDGEASRDEAPRSDALDIADLKSHSLSARECEILRCLMEGAPNKLIARQFGLTEATVKVHVKAILRKTGMKNRTQAAMWAASHMASDHRERPHGI
jgi:two-component system, NarL family, nitrate/nitrite response regulator NarL